MLNNILKFLSGVHEVPVVTAYGVNIPSGWERPEPWRRVGPLDPTPIIDEYNKPTVQHTASLDWIIKLMQDMSASEREATLLLLKQRYGGVEVSGE
jgi:hypothetical protein